MTVTLLEGHVTDVLAGLEPGTFHCAVTSPPYLWLRTYGTEGQVWQTADGDALCAPEQHEWYGIGKSGTRLRNGQGSTSPNWHGGKGDPLLLNPPTGSFCVHCHAWRGELGQEPTPELYVDHLVAVFRAVKRVLRPDGTLWVNLAGCLYNDPGGQNGGAPRLRNGEGASSLYPEGGQSGRGLKAKSLAAISEKAMTANAALGRQKRGRHPYLKPLDWVDVPGLFAQAMQRDGWCWRSDVTWVKPSALPESVSGTRWERCRTKTRTLREEGRTKPGGYGVRDNPGGASGGFAAAPAAEWADCPGCPKCSQTDGLVLRRGSGRPTKSTERVLLFVKGPGYFWDSESVRERPAEATIARLAQDVESQEGSWRANGGAKTNGPMRAVGDANGRNLRDWWVIGPEPLKDAHYAAYPSALPERCIKAGTSEWGCCPSCGAPWARVVDVSQEVKARNVEPDRYAGGADGEIAGKWTAAYAEQTRKVSTTLGWRPTCRCPGVAEQAPVPARCLDPFGGSGTTALAANRLGRDCTLVELKSEYATLARKRLGREPLSLFAWKPEDTPEEGEV